MSGDTDLRMYRELAINPVSVFNLLDMHVDNGIERITGQLTPRALSREGSTKPLATAAQYQKDPFPDP